MDNKKKSKGKQNGFDKNVDASELFQQLYDKALKLGIPIEEFWRLESLKAIHANREGIHWGKKLKSLLKWTFFSIFVVLCSVVAAYVAEWPFSKAQFTSFYFHIIDLDTAKEPCLFEASDYLAEVFRPPTSCDFCQGLRKIEKVEKISPERFEAVYAYSARPVVVTDGTKNWTAPNVFSYQFFRDMYSEGSPALENVERDCQFFPYRTNFSNLQEVFEMSEDRALMKDGAEPWYIGWSNCDFSAANTLRQHYERPYFLPRVAESSKTDWIFMGSPGYGAHMHIDNVEHPSWQAQITGTKKWTLEPPPECYYECHSSLEVVVDPGDIIVLDTNRWYHSTLNVGKDISITIGSEYD